MALFDEIKASICPEFMEDVTADKYITPSPNSFTETGAIGKFTKLELLKVFS